MKKSIFAAIIIFITTINTYGQQAFEVVIEPFVITNAPNVHSFSQGQTTDGKWVIIGGRTDGLHQRQPFAAFLATSNNTDISIVDPINNQVWTTSLNVLNTAIFEQLQSTNQEFIQRDSILYIFGGYGYSGTSADHITFPHVTAVDLEGVKNAIINGQPIQNFFRQITDSTFAVTGGQIGYMDDYFYLCGGQYFEGRYNPMGSTHGPGFTQIYTDEIRKFKLIDNGTTLSVSNYSATTDANELHRRDYNMSPQVFPDGTRGFTMFSGVFNPNDLPYLNSVNVSSSSYTPAVGFNQYLSHYHSAKLPIYDQVDNTMHTIFFGGISQYTMAQDGSLIKDDNVPFVKTISKVTRTSDSLMVESKMSIEMPALLGAGAEFIPLITSGKYIDNEILNINALPIDSTLVGYIYGGIESSQPNIFFSNTGTQSSASNQIFKVFINTNVTSITESTLFEKGELSLKAFPNPATESVTISGFIPTAGAYELSIYGISGKLISSQKINEPIGVFSIQLNLSPLPKGVYLLKLTGGKATTQKKLIIN